MNNLVTINSFTSSVDFEMVKSYLASCGIECFGRDEITNRDYLNGVNGGVKSVHELFGQTSINTFTV